MSSRDFQRFVAWRYLLERPMRLPDFLLGLFSLFLLVGVSALFYLLNFPRGEVLYTIPPNVPHALLIVESIGVGAVLVSSVMAILLSLALLPDLFRRSKESHSLLIRRRRQRLHGFLMVGAALAVLGLISAYLQKRYIGSGILNLGSHNADHLKFIEHLGHTRVALAAGFILILLVLVLRGVFSKHGPKASWQGALVTFAAALSAAASVGAKGAVVAGVCFGLAGVLGRILFWRHKGSAWFALLLIVAGAWVAGSAPLVLHYTDEFKRTLSELEWMGGFKEVVNPMELDITIGIACALAGLCLILVVIRFIFTFFTTVSIGGIAIGTMALVIVLSVMAGFESDMRSNILGSNAHVLVTRVDEAPFDDYQWLMDLVDETEGVVGYAPYLSSEVVVVANNTHGNVIIKGIDPERVAQVSELKTDLEEGDEDALEKLLPLSAAGAVVETPQKRARKADLNEPAARHDPTESVDPPPDDMFVPDDAEPLDFAADPGTIDDPGDLDLDALDRLDPSDPFISPRVYGMDGVIVGRELVKSLGLFTGQEVNIISPLSEDTPMGAMPRMKPLRIAGAFYSGMYEYDLRYVYVELGVLQEFLDFEEQIMGVEIRVKDPERAEVVAAAIASNLPDHMQVQDWRQLNKSLFSALKLEKIMMFIVLVIIVLVASFSIIGNLIMVVVEKSRDIAVLKTLGASDWEICWVFVTQGVIIGVVGTVIGVSLGLLGSWQLKIRGFPVDPDVYYIDKLPIQIEASSVISIASAGVLISAVATIYPAYLAARLRPVDGMRFQ